MERGAGGGAGERTLEQAFEQCVSGVARSNRMFERRVSGGRALEQAFKQRVIRGERERESEGGPDTSHRDGKLGVLVVLLIVTVCSQFCFYIDTHLSRTVTSIRSRSYG